MKAKVFKLSWAEYQKDPQAIWQILDQFKDTLKGNTAIKTHFGEPGNNNALRGAIIKPITDWVVENKIKAFLTDANTLYTGFRSDSKDHLETAQKHGFTKLGLPVYIADGDYPAFKLTKLKNQYKKLPIWMGKELMGAESILCISHLKGHGMFGFGGAIKNLGMGGALPVGKRVLHASIAGEINPEKCTLCHTCQKNCPANAIAELEKRMVIDPSLCIGCGECVTVCPRGAVEVSGEDVSICQEKTAVYAYGLMRNKPGVYVNFLININRVCDCAGQTEEILHPNIGIMVSDDPVALDQASLDWINESAGKDLLKEATGRDYNHILTMAEKIGLGSRKYQVTS